MPLPVSEKTILMPFLSLSYAVLTVSAASRLHGLKGVQQKIRENPFQLVLVRCQGRQLRIIVADNGDPSAAQCFLHRNHHRFYSGIDVGRDTVGLCLAGKIEEVFNDLLAEPGVVVDNIEVFLRLAPCPGIPCAAYLYSPGSG